MPCANQTITIPIGVYFNKNYTASFIAQNSGSYGVKVTYTNSYPPTFLGLMTLTVTVNGQTVKSGITVSQLTVLDIGQVNKGSQINIIITVNGAVTNIALPIYVTLGWVSDSEVCVYASDFPNIPILNGVKGAVCINLQQSKINIYNGCVQATGIPCIDCVLSKSIPLYGTLQPGENTIIFQASGPLSSNVISALEQALQPGKTVEGAYVKSISVNGSTLTVTIIIPQTQMVNGETQTAQFWAIVGIALLILGIALAITFLYVTVKATGVVAAGFAVGLALLLGGVGIGAGVFLYDKLKKNT